MRHGQDGDWLIDSQNNFQKVVTKINFFKKEVNKSNATKQMRTEKTGSKETHGGAVKKKIGC